MGCCREGRIDHQLRAGPRTDGAIGKCLTSRGVAQCHGTTGVEVTAADCEWLSQVRSRDRVRADVANCGRLCRRDHAEVKLTARLPVRVNNFYAPTVRGRCEIWIDGQLTASEGTDSAIGERLT